MFTQTKHFKLKKCSDNGDGTIWFANVYNIHDEYLGYLYYSDERNEYCFLTVSKESLYNLEQLQELTKLISDLTNKKNKKEKRKPKKEIEPSGNDDRSLEGWANIIMGKYEK